MTVDSRQFSDYTVFSLKMIGLNLKVCLGNDNAFRARDMLRGRMKSP